MHVMRVVQQIETGLSDLSKETFKSPKQNIQQMAYQTLVRPHLEYASAKPMWDPHTKENAHKIEMVQRLQPGRPQTIMPERLALLHGCTSWAGKHLKRDDQWSVSVSFIM